MRKTDEDEQYQRTAADLETINAGSSQEKQAIAWEYQVGRTKGDRIYRSCTTEKLKDLGRGSITSI